MRTRVLLPVLAIALAMGLLPAAADPVGAVLTAPDGTQPTVIRVPTESDTDRIALWGADLDVADFGTNTAEVWLHGPRDVTAFLSLGLPHRVVDTSDQQAQMATLRASEARAQAAFDEGESPGSALPTGRLEYRMLTDINADLMALADAHPNTARLVELPHTTLLGKTVYALEISRDVHVQSGEPVYLVSGVHHAREWPTAEFVTELAHDVLQNDGVDPQITHLVESSRLLLIPVVNADGYDVSRRQIHEQKRKNCRIAPGQTPTAAECEAPTASAAGVDPNRNYGTFWDGPGSGSSDAAENYRGEAPYSEPSIRNVVEYTSGHQVHVAVHNHTPDGRWLRAPSSPEEPTPLEEAQYDELAQTLGGIMGWPAGPWTEVYYVASGVAEEHAFYTTGIFGFTPENTPGWSGLQRFHPPYQAVIDQYTGTGGYEGHSLREALLTAWEAAVDPASHSVLTGTATPGATLTISKDISVETSCAIPGSAEFLTCPQAPIIGGPLLPTQSSDLRLETTMTVPDDGHVEWHVQPSLRPSQRETALLDEAWTLTCDGAEPQSITISRGETQAVDLTGCR